MRRTLLVLAVLGPVSGVATRTWIAAAGAAPPVAASPGFAVVELFTSEGCSSCPPADRLLAELASEYDARDVITLSFHVDYWNDIGWRDPYSDRRYSDRQRRYARSLGQGRVYTPQAVVNGRWETVGSRGDTLRTLIARALEAPGAEAPRVSLSRVARQDGALAVQSEVTGAPADAQLALLLVLPDARSEVVRGENANLTLAHHNVVRALVPATGNHTVLKLPEALKRGPVTVVALLSDPSSSRILAATQAIAE